METYLSQFAYLVTLILFFILSTKSRNPLICIFGFIYLIYSIGFSLNKLEWEYFGINIFVNFDSYHYLRLTLLNFTCIIGVFLEQLIRVQHINSFFKIDISKDITKDIAIIFIFLGLLALANEIKYYGISFLLLEKTIKYTSELRPNLFIISIDYILFIISGLYALIATSSNKLLNKFLYFILITFALLGFLMGYRYYIALFFLIILIKFNFLKKGTPFILLIVFIALFSSELASRLFGYIKFYDWVNYQGFWPYIFNDFSLLPNEIKAITTNTYLGFATYNNDLQPDMLAYFVKWIPFSERFYNFDTINQFYTVISRDMFLNKGQGAAFSFYLENYTSYFMPLITLLLLILLNNFHKSPLLKIMSVYFILSIIRNGLIIGISSIKIGIIIYFGVLLLMIIVKKGSSIIKPRTVIK